MRAMFWSFILYLLYANIYGNMRKIYRLNSDAFLKWNIFTQTIFHWRTKYVHIIQFFALYKPVLFGSSVEKCVVFKNAFKVETSFQYVKNYDMLGNENCESPKNTFFNKKTFKNIV